MPSVSRPALIVSAALTLLPWAHSPSERSVAAPATPAMPISRPPGEYERNLIYLGNADDEAAAHSRSLTQLHSLRPLAPHLKKVASSTAECLVLTRDGDLHSRPLAALLAQQPPVALARADFGDEEVEDAAAGEAHFLAVSAVGRLYAWGEGSQGQLGYGGLAARASPTAVKGLAERRVASVAAGAHHSVALTAEGHVYTFGRGLEGQLGYVPVLLCGALSKPPGSPSFRIPTDTFGFPQFPPPPLPRDRARPAGRTQGAVASGCRPEVVADKTRPYMVTMVTHGTVVHRGMEGFVCRGAILFEVPDSAASAFRDVHVWSALSPGCGPEDSDSFSNLLPGTQQDQRIPTR